MARLINRGLQVVLDFAVLSIAYWVAFLLRAEFRLSQNLTNLLLFTWPYVLVLQYVVMATLGVPRFSWRYISMRESGRIVLAMGVSAAVLAAARIGFATLDKVYDLPVI